MAGSDPDHPSSAPGRHIEIFVRSALVACLFAVIAGLALAVTGCASGQAPSTVGGALCLLLALAGLGALRGWAPAATAAALDLDWIQSDAAPATGERPAGQLIDLLEQWQALERQRGSANFDPWAVQAVRREIRKIVDRDSALDRLFRR